MNANYLQQRDAVIASLNETIIRNWAHEQGLRMPDNESEFWMAVLATSLATNIPLMQKIANRKLLLQYLSKAAK